MYSGIKELQCGSADAALMNCVAWSSGTRPWHSASSIAMLLQDGLQLDMARTFMHTVCDHEADRILYLNCSTVVEAWQTLLQCERQPPDADTGAVYFPCKVLKIELFFTSHGGSVHNEASD
jgi:hypothetical protein